MLFTRRPLLSPTRRALVCGSQCRSRSEVAPGGTSRQPQHSLPFKTTRSSLSSKCMYSKKKIKLRNIPHQIISTPQHHPFRGAAPHLANKRPATPSPPASPTPPGRRANQPQSPPSQITVRGVQGPASEVAGTAPNVERRGRWFRGPSLTG